MTDSGTEQRIDLSREESIFRYLPRLAVPQRVSELTLKKLVMDAELKGFQRLRLAVEEIANG